MDSESLAALVKDLPRSLQWGVMISDGTLFITDERGQFEVSLEWLLGER
ncbi:YaeQ family protein OS=Stutzerimonas stutzeri OX=316 GN=CXK95_18785 PE=4 SV=1 [Stutzerimonas stutzeri]